MNRTCRLTLVVERDPLRLASTLDVVEGHSAVIAVDSSQDDALSRKVLKLGYQYNKQP